MIILKLATNGLDLIKLETSLVTSDNKKSVSLEVTFDDSWTGYGKSATFKSSSSDKIYEVPLADNACVVPWEVLESVGTMSVGVRGVKDDGSVIASDLVDYKIAQGAKTGDGTSEDPTPTVYEQLLSNYGSVDQKITKEIQDRANAIATEKSERMTEVDVERKRIDNIVKLPSGSTSGDAELMDIRIGADGTTYDSAGTAVREQVSSLKGDLENVEESEYSRISTKTVATSNVTGYTFSFADFALESGDMLSLSVDNYSGEHYLGVRLYGYLDDGTTENITNVTVKQTIGVNYLYNISNKYRGCSIWVRSSAEETTLNCAVTVKRVPPLLIKAFSLKSIITPQAFGAVGDGVADDTDAIQRAFNSSNSTIVFPDGKYMINSTITDTIGHSVIMINSNIILGNQFTDEFAVNINVPVTENYHKQYEYRLNVNCYHRAKGIVVNSSRGNFFNIVVKAASEGVTIPTNSSTYENIFNIQAQNYGYIGQIGVNNLRSDNIFNSIVTVNFRTGVVNYGYSHYVSIHTWLVGDVGKNSWGNSACYKEQGNSQGGTIDYLYIDTVRYGIIVEDYGRVHVNQIDVNCGTTVFGERFIEANKVYIVSAPTGNVYIGNIKAYDEYKYFRLIDSETNRVNVTITHAQIENWLKDAIISDVLFSFGCGTYYQNIFAILPTEIKNIYTDGMVSIEILQGNVGFRLVYWGSDNVYYCLNASPTSDSWKSIAMT